MSTTRKSVEGIVFAVVGFFFIILFLHSVQSHRQMHSFDYFLNNPNFTGIVVGKGTTGNTMALTTGLRVPGRSVYFIRVAGVRTDNDRRTQVNNRFIVCREIFDQFEVGDVISYPG